MSGELLLLHAAYIAIKVAREQGNVVLTVDPFDDAPAQLWLDRYPVPPVAGP